MNEQNGNDTFLDNEQVIKDVYCSHCGNKIDDANSLFCPKCGYALNGGEPAYYEDFTVKDGLRNAVNKVRTSDFVQSIKSDVHNSKSLKLIRNGIRNTANRVRNSQIIEDVVSTIHEDDQFDIEAKNIEDTTINKE